jgi:ABC-type bacteriocin/lantibiotic exporter with double-glycine peptidase domain
MLFLRSPTLTCVSLSVVPLIGIGAMGMSRLVKKNREKLRTLQGESLNFAIERFTSMSTVKLNGREETEVSKHWQSSFLSLPACE